MNNIQHECRGSWYVKKHYKIQNHVFLKSKRILRLLMTACSLAKHSVSRLFKWTKYVSFITLNLSTHNDNFFDSRHIQNQTTSSCCMIFTFGLVNSAPRWESWQFASWLRTWLVCAACGFECAIRWSIFLGCNYLLWRHGIGHLTFSWKLYVCDNIDGEDIKNTRLWRHCQVSQNVKWQTNEKE